MDFENLWVFGDSYSTPHFCVNPSQSFWGLFSQFLGCQKIKNCSKGGNSWSSVCHLLISMQKNYDWHRDFFLIGVPPLERITVFDDYQNTQYHGHEFAVDTWNEDRFTIESHVGLVCLQNFGNDRHLVTFADRSWTETMVLRDLFLLTSWLDSNDANYLIINLSKPLDKNNTWGPTDFLLPYAINHARCILFENTYFSINDGIVLPSDYDQYGKFGHHGSEGNQRFFELSLQPRLEKLYQSITKDTS